jgi:hypothetical protein
MWRIESLEIQQVVLDFSSAELGQFHTSALVGDETTLVNATSLIEVEHDGCVQVLVCESCGTSQCQPGGWVQPRRFEGALIWLPCFERLAKLETEFLPPGYVTARGLPFFADFQARQLGELAPPLRLDVTLSLAARDLAMALQWLAPCRVLGKPGDPVRLARDTIIATSGDDLTHLLDQLETLLDDALSDDSPVVPTRVTPGPELYLHAERSTPTWNPFVMDNSGKLRLSFDGLGAPFARVL